MSWRTQKDPMAEARRLGVDKAVTNLKWSPARLEREMALSESAKMFVGRVVTALTKAVQKEVDRPRLLAQRSEYGYTDSPHLAVRSEMEAITADEQAIITEMARSRSRLEVEAERERQKERALHQRLAEAQAKARARGIDGSGRERRIERQVLEYERFVEDRAA